MLAADNTFKKHQMRTPSGRNLSVDHQTALNVELPSRTPNNKTAMMTPRSPDLLHKRQLSQPNMLNMPFQFQ